MLLLEKNKIYITKLFYMNLSLKTIFNIFTFLLFLIKSLHKMPHDLF